MILVMSMMYMNQSDFIEISSTCGIEVDVVNVDQEQGINLETYNSNESASIDQCICGGEFVNFVYSGDKSLEDEVIEFITSK